MKNSQSYQNIVRVASDLRNTDPVAALNIIKSLRSLVSTEAEPAGSISDASREGAPRAGVASTPADTAAAMVKAFPGTAVVAAPDFAEVPLPVLLKVAASSPSAKAALGPFILAAAKKKKKGKGKVPPQFLKNIKKKGDAPPAKGKKASIAADDADW